ncbi:MAG: methyltransferase domain-containing protein [Miltoncostaeaceae bacterium]
MSGPGPSACYLLPGTDLWGGIKIAFEQAEQLALRGWEVTVASPAEAPEWYDLDVPFLRVPDFSGRRLPRADLYMGTFFTTASAAHDTGLGIGAHLVQGYEGLYPDLAEHREAIEFAYSLRTVKVAVSPHLAALVEHRHGQGVYLVRNGIDTSLFHPVGRATDVRERLRVGVVGPFEVAWKGIAKALSGLARLRDEGHAIDVVRVSQSARSDDEHRLFAADEYHHAVAPEAMADILRSLDVFVSASTEIEGFGLPAIEAMATGCACALADIPAYRDFGRAADHDGAYARIAPMLSAEDVAEAVRPLIEDDYLRAELSAGGAELGRRYGWDRVGPELDRTLRRLIAEERSRWETRDERMVPGENDALTESMHRQRYSLTEAHAPGRRVLDVGCGVGYGSRALAAAGAGEVVALDRSTAALRYAREPSAHPALRWVDAALLSWEWPRRSFDLAVFFEVFEHVDVPLDIVAGIARSLTAEGTALISTPNRQYYSPGREPDYVHHIREYELRELTALLGGYFDAVEVVGQRLAVGSLTIGPVDVDHDMAFIATCSGPRPRPFASCSVVVAAPERGAADTEWRSIVRAWPEAFRAGDPVELRLLAPSPDRAARLAASALDEAGHDPDLVADIAIVGCDEPLPALGRQLPGAAAVFPTGPDRDVHARLAAASGLPVVKADTASLTESIPGILDA